MIKFSTLLDVDESNIGKNTKPYQRENMKNKIPWVDKYRPRKLDDIVYQDDVTRTLTDTLKTGNLPHMLFHGSSGTGKCLDPSTPIIMYDGSIKIAADIIVNDKLMGDDNTSRTVLSTINGTDQMYKIIQENGDEYIVNSAHILSLKMTNMFVMKKKTVYWTENFELKCRTFSTDPDDEENDEYKDDSDSDSDYLDNKEKEKENINFEIQNFLNQKKVNKINDVCDIPILEYLTKPEIWKEMYHGFKSEAITCWEKQECALDPYIYGQWLAHNENSSLKTEIKKIFMEKIGTNHLAKTEYFSINIPKIFKINDVATRKNLLNGYLSVMHKNESKNRTNMAYFYNTDKIVFDEIAWIARSLGMHVVVNKKKQFDKLYSGTIQEPTTITKQNKLTIKKLGKGTYAGFELDKNGRFLIKDFTVTHNTSTILAIAYQLFGPTKFKERVIELNASDERGINVVRNKIMSFAKSAVGNADPNYPSPPYKIIILDEADAMTTEAQSALRKMIENNSSITRFCFICNYINQIIEPITSRCVKFRFKPILSDKMLDKLESIAKKENLFLEEGSNLISVVADLSKGDMRKAIMLLQNLKYFADFTKKDYVITLKDIYEIANVIPIDELNKLWKNSILSPSTDINIILTDAFNIRSHSYPISNVLEQLEYFVINDQIISDNKKSLICLQLASTERRITEGADEFLQLLNVLSYIKGIIHNVISYSPDPAY